MPHLIIQLSGNKILNKTIWEPTLSVYDDYIVWKKRKWFTVKEITISYKQIAQINLTTSIMFGDLEIVIIGSDTRTVGIKFAPKKQAIKVKRLIGQKVHSVQAGDENIEKDTEIKNIEKSIARLTELKKTKQITNREYEKKKRSLIK